MWLAISPISAIFSAHSTLWYPGRAVPSPLSLWGDTHNGARGHSNRRRGSGWIQSIRPGAQEPGDWGAAAENIPAAIGRARGLRGGGSLGAVEGAAAGPAFLKVLGNSG